jgi:hemerythrin-like metal-binding protein
MKVLQWSDNYSVGNLEIDQQHKQLFSMFAQLVDGIEKGGASFHLEQVFTQLYGYIKNHFRYEERVMKKADFPGFSNHKKKHEKIKNRLKKYRDEFNQAKGKKKDKVASDVALFLQDWLQEHIKGEDQQYVPYISQPQEPIATAVKQSPSKGKKAPRPFLWSDNYSVGNKKIDEQHQRLFGIFCGLHKAIESGEAIFGVEKTFTQLRGYVRNHFRYEESLMKKGRYPGYKDHKKNHDKICDTLKEYRKQFNSQDDQGKEKVAKGLAIFFESWLKKHIKSEDQQYGPYLKD